MAVVALLAQGTPQNPSPMSDSTWPHPRVIRYDVPGCGALSTVTLYISDRFKPRGQIDLVVHFHGAPGDRASCPERERADGARHRAAGLGSRVYADAFADAAMFTRLLDEAASDSVSSRGDRSNRPITLSSLAPATARCAPSSRTSSCSTRQRRHPARQPARVVRDRGRFVGTAPQGSAVNEASLDVFTRLAAEAAAGRKRFWVTHSEVYPGTYASTTGHRRRPARLADSCRVGPC